MKRALTIYILHCGDDKRHDPPRTVEHMSMSDIDFKIEIVPSFIHDLNDLEPLTRWKLFIYSDEWISVNMVKALPSYLEQDDFNVVSIFRLEYPPDENDPKISISPRLFDGRISLKNNSLVPADIQLQIDKLTYTNMLDAFIFGKRS